LVGWEVVFSKQAVKDSKKIAEAGLKPRVEAILEVLQKEPLSPSHSFEKLIGKLNGYYSRRINIQHRLVYQVLEDIKTVKVVRMWTHYE
jgi:Txe/YoeB family toxin of toxin-antitoxin system